MLFFAFLFSIESMAAVVSDNDGAAFVTKAEFEALKNNFATQVEKYNTSIDSKIDGAIANYLAGRSLQLKTVERFPAIGNQKVLICNTKYINDMSFGKIGINWRFLIDLCHITIGGNNNAGSIKMTRMGTSVYEAFVYNEKNDKFLYYGNNLKYDTNVVYTVLCPINAGLANRTDFTELKLRWGANAYSAIAEGRDDTIDSAGSLLWHDQFGHNRFFAFYATYLNFGTTYLSKEHAEDCMIDNNTSVTVSGDQIKWIMDSSDTKSQVWVRDPVASPSSLNRLNQTNYKTTSKEFATPYAAGITTTASVDSVDRWNTADGQQFRPLSYDGNVTWVDSGTYSNNTSPASGQSKKWNELHLETNEKDPKKIVNSNYSETILDDYAKYNFHGYITEGLPLGIFKEDSKLSFKLDTRSIGTSVNFAINKVGFSTDEIINIGEVNGLKLIIDGVKYTNAVASLSSDKIHTIEIETEDTTAIFCKMSISNSDSTNRKKRFIITWPETYELMSY